MYTKWNRTAQFSADWLHRLIEQMIGCFFKINRKLETAENWQVGEFSRNFGSFAIVCIATKMYDIAQWDLTYSFGECIFSSYSNVCSKKYVNFLFCSGRGGNFNWTRLRFRGHQPTYLSILFINLVYTMRWRFPILLKCNHNLFFCGYLVFCLQYTKAPFHFIFQSPQGLI